MRNLKKVLALVIAFSMMLSVVAFAGYADVDANADYASAVELTSALGIFQGDESGNFNADKTITRAEMAAVIIRMQGLDASAKASAGATQFADVAADHWASGYVNLASQNGIIKGTGDGNFAPNDTLTYEAAVAMIVRALGFEPIAEQKGGWTAGYVAVANTYKVTEGAAASATRGNLAILVANAMNTPMMDQTSYGSDEKFEILNGKGDKEYRTLLTDRDIYVVDGIVGEKDGEKVAFDVYEDSDDKEFKANKDENFEIGNSNVLAYADQQVTAYVQKDGRNYVVLAVVPSNVGETFTLLSDNIDVEKSTATKIEYFVDPANSNKTKDIAVVANIPVEFNKGASTKTLADVIALDDVELVFIENTGDTKFDKVIATQYTSDRVDYVDADKNKISFKNIGRTVEFDFENEDATIILVDDKGDALEIADFAKDDVVAIVADNATNPARYQKYIKVVKLANATVTGTVDESREDEDGVLYVTIGGQEYPWAYAEEPALDAEGTFYIGLTGKVIDFEGDLADANYGYVLEGALANGVFSAAQYQLKILTMKDGIVTFDIAKKQYDDIYKDYINKEGNFAFDKDAFLWEKATAENKVATHRLVEYKLNGDGEIKEIAPAAGTFKNFAIADNHEYNGGTQAINGASLEDDVVIFNIDVVDVDDASVVDISFLVDEAKYTGYALRDEDREYSAMVISDLESKFSAEEGFAIVTKVSTGKNAEGDEIAKVTYVQNEEEGVLTFEEEVSVDVANSKHALAVGDVFMFVADAEGLVSEYIVIASVKGGIIDFVGEKADIEAALATGKTETKFALGYIENDKRIAKAKGEILTVGGKEYVVPTAAYKYTFNTIGKNKGIEVSDFMYDAEYCELNFDEETDKPDETATAYPVLIRMVDDEVVDIYGTNKAATIAAPQALLDAWNEAHK